MHLIFYLLFMLLPLLGSLAFVIAMILYLSRRFDRLYAIDERRRAGQPTDDLEERGPIWTVVMLVFVSSLGSTIVYTALEAVFGVGPWMMWVLWVMIFMLGIFNWSKIYNF